MSDPKTLKTVGILGAGRVGTAVARQAMRAGYTVNIATAKPAEDIELIVDIVTPGAQAVDAAEASQQDLVVLAVPLHKYRTVDASLLAGRTVIDVMNYWAPVDGAIADFEETTLSSSEVIQDYLSAAHVVKTLNHIGYHELEEDGQPAGAHKRRALALAGDHRSSKDLVAAFIDRLGYDPVDAGPLAAGRAFGPGTEIFNGAHTAGQLQTLLNTALQSSHT